MSHTEIDVAVIGGGAAGFFAAIEAASAGRLRVVILEKSNKLLSKVKISGGGRCNLTHNCSNPSQLIHFYPRGGRSLKKAFSKFGTADTCDWFEARGVALKTEADGRIFPQSDNSQTVIDCLLGEAQKRAVEIRMRSEVVEVLSAQFGFRINLTSGESLKAAKVIVAMGGSSKSAAYKIIKDLDLQVIDPIASLFTFNVPDSDLKDLQGLSVPEGSVQIPGTHWKEGGPVLITHWGFSAPAVIKLSSKAAIDLHQCSYQFPILINWTGIEENQLRESLKAFANEHPKKQVSSNQLFDVPLRLWLKLCKKAGITSDQQYHNLPKKKLNRLVEILTRCPYKVNGKTTFKEEFVSCGGVDLAQVNLKNFESKKQPGLYIVGEALNVDGLTGGFNFQHAWTSGYLAGQSASENFFRN